MSYREQAVLEILKAAAKRGDRAPFNHQIDGGSNTVQRLTKGEFIQVEVYAHNWRVIEIIETGERTAECPHATKPYKVTGGTIARDGRKTRYSKNKPTEDDSPPGPTDEERKERATAITSIRVAMPDIGNI